MDRYTVRVRGEEVETDEPGDFAGYEPGRIFGALDCSSGRRMKRENRVFFAEMEDAVYEDYRPCKNCQPVDAEEFLELYGAIEEERLDAWQDYLDYAGEWKAVEELAPDVANEVKAVLED